MGLEWLLSVVQNLLTISSCVCVIGFEVNRVDPLRGEASCPLAAAEAVEDRRV